ncbi:hypothetical protein HPB52_009308 [Rhipicephalus sanguineus]|uniref:Uncharacterized protein n=1 Tax=Rhipicephalus sanguineus TaxID=34632 RepID=A0A9D4T949_RHISA|nr:hypothetical protein HPB52_009308 [Rhipicephalus sanguineus]
MLDDSDETVAAESERSVAARLNHWSPRLASMLRCSWIVRNKAAEKAKHHHVSSNGGSPQPQSSPTSVITHAPASAHESSVSAAAAAAALQRPSYSINGILGIPSAEAAKRKRDDQVSQVHGDSARDMNGDHGIHEDEVKRSRAQYNGEQIYSNLSPNMWAKWTKQDELKAGMADLPTSNGSPYHHLTSQTSQPAPPSQGGAFEQAFSPVVSSAEKQPAEYDVAMTTINSQSTAVYSPPLGSNSLTPLTPISMQEVKSLVNSGASLIETSPNPHSYHPAAAATGSEIQGSPSPAKAEAPCPLSSLTVLQPVQGAIPGYGSSFSQFSAAPGKLTGSAVASSAVAGIPGADYAYASPYTQYSSAAAYGAYGYGSSGIIRPGRPARASAVRVRSVPTRTRASAADTCGTPKARRPRPRDSTPPMLCRRRQALAPLTHATLRSAAERNNGSEDTTTAEAAEAAVTAATILKQAADLAGNI